MLFENALYSEIRRFYPEEFQIGCHALDLIEERIKVRLPEDEAASIAFHLVNSEFGGMRLRDTQIMTEIIRHLIGMIRADYHFPEDLVSVSYTHLDVYKRQLLRCRPKIRRIR